MPEDDTIIILGGLAVIAWLLLRSPSVTAAATPSSAAPDPNCPTCGDSSSPAPAPANSLTQARPNIGSWQNDAVLQELTKMIDASNAAGNWDASWALAAKRDAWIKTQGY